MKTSDIVIAASFVAFAIIILLLVQVASGDGIEYRIMRVTAYCSCEICCGEYSDGVTASGHVIQEGDRFVAAPRSIPLKTWVRIPGYNANEPVRVEDRGGAITGDRIDLYMDTHQEALAFGVQYIRVEICR